jgi:hypothetical protein
MLWSEAFSVDASACNGFNARPDFDPPSRSELRMNTSAAIREGGAASAEIVVAPGQGT